MRQVSRFRSIFGPRHEPERHVPVASASHDSLLRLNVLGVGIHSGSRLAFLQEMERLSDHRLSAYVCFVNVHMVMEAERDSGFLQVVNEADLNCPDGLPIAKSIGWFHAIRQRQIAGPDTLPLLLQMAQRTGKRVFVLGSTPEVLAAFQSNADDALGEGVVVGTFSPPFRKLSPEEDQDLVQRINSTKADLIFVALGCPKQEKWMAEHRGKVQGCMYGLGYAIPVYAGIASRAPRWMIERGLEWMFRLSSDPRRLFMRYAKTNSAFLIKALREWSQHRSRYETP